jgi:uncharacterized protein
MIIPTMGVTSVGISSGRALLGQTRLSVLGLLYGRPDEARYLNDIVRAVGAGTGAVQRELARLTAAGLLRRVVRGKQVYFQANPDAPIFPEIRGLIVKTVGAVAVLRSGLEMLGDGIHLAFIYGSVARGEETMASDVDLIVIGAAGLFDVVSALAPAQVTLRREVNPAVFPRAEARRKLREGDPFLTAVVEGPKLFVIGGEHELAELVR